jgi:chromate reductase
MNPTRMKKILAISGSTRKNSSNFRLLKKIAALSTNIFEVTIFDKLDQLPHFNPDLEAPSEIIELRNLVDSADGVIICTPEYVFSLPGSLKNAIEWCVATTVFSNKSVGLITASASGEKGHESLQLIMSTLEAKFDEETTLLIKGIKGKVDAEGEITDPETFQKIRDFIGTFEKQSNSRT